MQLVVSVFGFRDMIPRKPDTLLTHPPRQSTSMLHAFEDGEELVYQLPLWREGDTPRICLPLSEDRSVLGQGDE